MNNLPHLLYGRMLTYGPYVYFYPYLYFFSNSAYTSCVWLVVFLSVERYFALCHPLKHKIYDAKRRSICISILCLICACLYNLPRYFELKTVSCFDLRTNNTVWLSGPSEFRNMKIYWFAYKVVLGPLFFSLGPFAFLCFLSIRMWQEVKRTRVIVLRRRFLENQYSRTEMAENCSGLLIETSNLYPSKNNFYNAQNPELGNSNLKKISVTSYNRNSINGSNDKHRRILTYTLLCVVFKFLICHTLPAVIDLCESLMSNEQFSRPLMENLVDTSTLLVVANSSFNLFIYAWCSGGFRKRMRTMLSLTPKTSNSIMVNGNNNNNMRSILYAKEN
jgi:hypothetical protein